MIKLIAVDLDGTLLTDDMDVPAASRKTIQEIVKEGIYFVIATGRPYKTAKKILAKLEIDQPMILHNGSIIKDELGDLKICRAIDYETSKDIMEYCNEKRYICSIIYNDCDRAIMNVEDDFTIALHRNNHDTEPEILGHMLEDKEEHGAITKIIVTDERAERIDGMLTDLQEVFGRRVNVMKSGKFYIDLIPSEASKGFGVEILAKRFGISSKEVMAIGDSGNDISMLSFADCSVAMGNAEEQVKEKSEHVTLTNNEEGVAEAIRKFILNR